MAYISTGAKLVYGKNTDANAANAVLMDGGEFQTTLEANSWAFPGLQEIGAINIAGAGGSYDQIEITTLADNKHVYMDGLIADSGNSGNEIACKFLYEPTMFKAFKDILDAESNPAEGAKAFANYVVVIPEGGYFEIEAGLSSVNLETVSTNSALTFTVGLAVRSIEMKTGTYTRA